MPHEAPRRRADSTVTRPGNSQRLGDGSPLLEVSELVVHHGQLRALDAVSLRVFPGEVYAIIGANGAGKSTLLRTIAGLHHPTEGSIVYDGADVTGMRPEKRATAETLEAEAGDELAGGSAGHGGLEPPTQSGRGT